MFGQNMKQVSKTVSTHLNCLNVMVPINIQTKIRNIYESKRVYSFKPSPRVLTSTHNSFIYGSITKLVDEELHEIGIV